MKHLLEKLDFKLESAEIRTPVDGELLVQMLPCIDVADVAVISKLGIRWHQGDQHCEEIFTNCAAEKPPATLRLAGRLVVLLYN